MSVDPTTAAQLNNFKADPAVDTAALGSMPSAEDLAAMEALEQGYLELVKSIVESSGNSSWTGWNWRENDPT